MLVIRDKFQEYMSSNFDTHMLVMLNEFLFYSIFVYYYYFGPIHDSDQNFIILKYIALIFLLRYIFNYITTQTIINEKETSGKETTKETIYYQLNSRIAIMTIILLALTKNQNITTSLCIIFGYALLSSAAKYGFTIDNLLTVGITYFIFSLHI